MGGAGAVPAFVAEMLDGGPAEKLFRATGHPHHALMAWRNCRMAGAPIPAWVVGYIDACVIRYEAALQKAALSGGKLDGEPDAVIAAAFGFSGKPGRKNWATELFDGKAMEIGLAVETAVAAGAKQYAAVEAVAKEHGVSAGTVRKYNRAYRGKMGLLNDG